jgi:hypothetical protein
MPILGIVAAAGGFTKFGDFYQIATTTASGGAVSTIDFNSIPQDYTHLQLRAIGRATSANVINLTMRFNGDTANNYSAHWLTGDGATATSSGLATTNLNINLRVNGSGQLANSFGVTVIDILDYTNTNKFKTVRSMTGYDNNGSGEVYFGSSNWRSTSAITSIRFTDQGGGNIAQHSSFALYGIRAS